MFHPPSAYKLTKQMTQIIIRVEGGSVPHLTVQEQSYSNQLGRASMSFQDYRYTSLMLEIFIFLFLQLFLTSVVHIVCICKIVRFTYRVYSHSNIVTTIIHINILTVFILRALLHGFIASPIGLSMLQVILYRGDCSLSFSGCFI